jgi:hypothetical protein
MKTRLAALIALLVGILSAQVEMNYSYEMKYGDGMQVTPLTQNTTDYSYFENLLEINTTFSNGLYLFTQLEYSEPPILGESIRGLNKFYLDYYWDRLYFKAGDIYSLQGRGLTLNLIQDQNIDYDNSVRGVEARYNVFDNLSLFTILGQTEYKFRSDPAERENDLSLDSKLGFVGVEYEHDLIGTTSTSILFNDISSDNTTDYKLTEYDFSWNRQIKNIDLFIEYVISNTNANENTSGEKLYAMIYTDIFDYGITYEYKNYLLKHNYNIITASPPIVFRESSSTLVSSNAHAINWNDEIGHQIEINKKFSDHFIIQANTSLAYSHPKESSSKISIMDVLKMDGEADIYHQYPFRQTYVEASGWINDDNIYYKIGIDKFDDFKKYIDNPFSVSALTFPSLFTFNILKNSSVTIYAEYQAREEINRMPDLLVERTDNYTDQYYSLTYNHPSLFSVTYFYRQELYKGEWGEFWDELVGGDYDDLYGPPSNSGNIESWQGIDVTYKINTSTQISLFTGSQKGGLVCANGICAVQPGFDDGYKITFRSLF